MALDDSLSGGVKVSLFLNHACNLRCRYCYNGAQVDRPMPSEIARRAVELAFEQAGTGPLLLSFFGGEPLLELDRMEEVIAFSKAEAARRGTGLRFSLSTNGTLLDDRSLRLIKANRIRVRLSLDGGPRAQDANRRFINNRSTYARASVSLKRLIADGIPVRVEAVVDPKNARHLVTSCEALRALGARDIRFAPHFGDDWTDEARQTLEASLAALADRWAAGLREASEAGTCLEPFDGKVAGAPGRGGKASDGCGFGRSELAIAPSGRIYPCERMVKHDDGGAMCLGDLEKGLDPARRQQLLERLAAVEPECARCEVRERCQSRCGCLNHELTGDPGRVSPLLCWYERTVLRETDRVTNASLEAHPGSAECPLPL